MEQWGALEHGTLYSLLTTAELPFRQGFNPLNSAHRGTRSTWNGHISFSWAAHNPLLHRSVLASLSISRANTSRALGSYHEVLHCIDRPPGVVAFHRTIPLFVENLRRFMCVEPASSDP